MVLAEAMGVSLKTENKGWSGHRCLLHDRPGGVASLESATGNGLLLPTAPLLQNLRPRRRRPSNPSEDLYPWATAILFEFSAPVQATGEMVVALKRPHPQGGHGSDDEAKPRGRLLRCSVFRETPTAFTRYHFKRLKCYKRSMFNVK